MAQLVACLVWDQEAGGSSPPSPTIFSFAWSFLRVFARFVCSSGSPISVISSRFAPFSRPIACCLPVFVGVSAFGWTIQVPTTRDCSCAVLSFTLAKFVDNVVAKSRKIERQRQ